MTGVNAVIDNYLHVTGFIEFITLVLSSFAISVIVIRIVSHNKMLGRLLFLLKD
jgi:hypothetical protein